MFDKIKEIYNSVKETLEETNQKVKSPFISTFIGVWLIHHWELVFMLFYSDKAVGFFARKELMLCYIFKAGYCGLLWWPLGVTFGALAVYLLLTNLSLILYTISNSWIKVGILKVFDSKKTIDKQRLIDAQKSFEKLKTELEALKEKYFIEDGVKTKNEVLEKDISELRKVMEDLSSKGAANANSKSDINKMFEGVWKLDYASTNGEFKGSEYLLVRDNYYIVDNIKRFYLDMVEVDLEAGTIKFRKKGITTDDIRVLITELRITEGLYEGDELDIGSKQRIRVVYRETPLGAPKPN